MASPLTQLVKDNLRSVTTTDAPAPDLAGCHRVKRVAGTCLAAAAGVQAGDLLVTFQDGPAADFPPEIDKVLHDERRYTFWSPRSRKATHVVASGMAPGVDLQRTVENVLRDFEKRQSPYDLEIVWRAGNWKALEELSRFAMTGSRKPPGLLRRVLGGDASRRGTPALLFLGAALVEQGSVDEGLNLVGEFVEKVAEGWTTNFQGIAQLYVALALLSAGEAEEAMGRLGFAWESTHAPQVAEVIEKLTGEPPEPEGPGPWVGKRFPVDYALEPLAKGGRRASLADSLRALPSGKLLAVCLLGGYRINGPYNDLMQRYRGYDRHFAPFLHELHVITENPEEVGDRYAHFLEGEKGVLADGLAAAVVLDRGAEVSGAIEPDLSPCVLLVDGDRTIHSQNMLEPVELWDALASLRP